MCDPIFEDGITSKQTQSTDFTGAALSPDELTQAEKLNRLAGEALCSNYQPTMELRRVSYGPGGPEELQQLWVAQQVNGGVSHSWRTIPLVNRTTGKPYV